MKPKLLSLAGAAAAGWLGVAPPASASGVGISLQGLLHQPSALVRVASQEKSYTLGQLVIEAPWARATPGGAQVGGGYLKITNKGSDPDRLLGGTLPMATSVEVHEMSMSDGIMRMRHLGKGLEIKPGETVELKPGGTHMMFMGLREGLKEGRPVKGTLVFERAGTIEVEYRVAPIGAKSGGSHKHH